VSLENVEQLSMLDDFSIAEDWRKEWVDMPEFIPARRNEWIRIGITKPKNYDNSATNQYYKENGETTELPIYPVYVISKGRWKKRMTSRTLEAMGIPYRIVIEPQEYDNYAAVIDPGKILVLPFSNLGQGSIPARNWVWEHAIDAGAKRHWILDDNISGFGVLKNEKRLRTKNGNLFSLCEKFTERYSNIAQSGIRYRFHHNFVQSPYLLNTRIYSCILIKNDIRFRWRGKYNEDTDLSLRILKDGLCTILFTWCYCDKQATMTSRGGNTDELYKGDGRLLMAQSLKEQHPDLVTVIDMWGRPQHYVDYKVFKNNKLIKIQK